MRKHLLSAATVAATLLGITGLALVVFSAAELLSTRAELAPADLGSLAVAGGTLLLAAFTGGLAVLTFLALEAARAEARDTEAALELSRQQAKSSAELASHTRTTFLASTRPLLTEPRAARSFSNEAQSHSRITIDAALDHTCVFAVAFVNAGPGSAVVGRSLFGMGTVALPADQVLPRIAPAGEMVQALFTLVPEHDIATVRAVMDVGGQYDLKVAIEYSDLAGERTWRSLCWLKRDGRSKSFEQINLEVTDISAANDSSMSAS